MAAETAPFTVERLITLNRVAAVLHLVLAAAVYTQSTRWQVYRLHVDESFYSGQATAPVYSNRVGSQQNDYSIICDLAEPNYFSPSGALSLEITNYPRHSDFTLTVNHLVAAFFLLSAAFQSVGIEAFSHVKGRYMGHRPDGHQVQHIYHEMFDKNNEYAYMTINIVRYVEYSFSASVMLVTIALLSGITNQETILCIATLSFACMILGWIAEFCFNISFVVEKMQKDVIGKDVDPNSDKVQYNFPYMCRFIAWLSHGLSWACIVVPWVIILQRYQSLFRRSGGCTAPAGADSNTSPPGWLQFVFLGQAILFLLFGAVQLYQFRRNWRGSMWVEFSYITLSLTAKAILGLVVSFNLFV